MQPAPYPIDYRISIALMNFISSPAMLYKIPSRFSFYLDARLLPSSPRKVSCPTQLLLSPNSLSLLPKTKINMSEIQTYLHQKVQVLTTDGRLLLVISFFLTRSLNNTHSLTSPHSFIHLKRELWKALTKLQISSSPTHLNVSFQATPVLNPSNWVCTWSEETGFV